MHRRSKKEKEESSPNRFWVFWNAVLASYLLLTFQSSAGRSDWPACPSSPAYAPRFLGTFHLVLFPPSRESGL